MEQPMSMNGRAGEEAVAVGLSNDALTEIRHEMRNLLNAIKLSCAVLHRRQRGDADTVESLRDIEQSADGINDLLSKIRAHQKDD